MYSKKKFQVLSWWDFKISYQYIKHISIQLYILHEVNTCIKDVMKEYQSRTKIKNNHLLMNRYVFINLSYK